MEKNVKKKRWIYIVIAILLSIHMMGVFLTGCKNENDSGKISLLVSKEYGVIKPVDIYQINDGYINFWESNQNIELQKKYNLEKDYFFYFKMASDAGYSYAKNNLYKYYFERKKCIGDTTFSKAYIYLKDSADLGNVYAMNKYAREYLWGYMIKGHRDNPKKLKWQALEYFDAAAALFDSWAAFNILSFYSLDENGVEMIKKLPRINGEDELFNKYIIKLYEICDGTTKEDFKKKYDAWLVENGEINKRHK